MGLKTQRQKYKIDKFNHTGKIYTISTVTCRVEHILRKYIASKLDKNFMTTENSPVYTVPVNR